VKKRILNLGLPATHDLITNLGGGLNDALSISDFDAFVFDPPILQQSGVSYDAYVRRQHEIRDLLAGKGGVVVCLLRPIAPFGFAHSARGAADAYDLFDLVAPDALVQIRSALRAGRGSRVDVVPSAKGASAGYFRVLLGTLRFAAYLDTAPANLEGVGGTVFAVDSVPHPIGVEFAVGAGRICFVPVPEGATGDRVGSAIVRLVEAHYGGPIEIEAPPWLVEVGVPGATAHDTTIAQLEEKKGQVEAEVAQLTQKRTDLLNYRVLLYGYGKSVLEPVVRSAFRLLGFGVPEPDEYAGDWDVELHDPRSSATAIGEVEGSEGIVDVDKYRQLLDYVQSEVLEGRDHKGILVGNGYRLTAPDAAERQSQFSGHALLGAKKNGFCLLPTTELFKAVCAVLEAVEDEGQKIRIRDSILSTVGVWSFAREAAVQQESAAASAASSADVGKLS
jgi:hypothetical protein